MAASATSPGPATGASPVAEARSVSKRFGSTVAVDDVSLAIRPGESHALVGRNGAGKSTLVAMLTGLSRPDRGEIRFGGEPAPAIAEREAWRRYVACVYQRSTIIPSLSVAENLFINRQSEDRGGLISWSSLRGRAAKLLADYGVEIDPSRPAADLTVEQRQMVEISRALSFGARFIILDEPTAQLDAPAAERLFDRMRALQGSGVTFLYISHHLHEIYEVCQTVTVLRDARHILTSPVGELPQQRLVEAMTGEAQGLREVPTRSALADDAPPVLELRGLTLAGAYEDCSLTVRRGEKVGVTGSASSGSVALGETIVGLRAADAGEVVVAGSAVAPGRVPATLAAGVGFVPQDRHKEGFVPLLSIAENTTLPIAGRLGRFGLISSARRTAVAEKLIDELAIKAAGPGQAVAALSGGNQQKVVMARALASEPRVIVLIDPTAGVDVRAKESLLEAVDDVAERGAAVMVVSDELDDLRRCDRVLVMFHGRISAEMPRGWRDGELVGAIEGIEERRAD